MNIEIKNISKSFGSIEANKNINLKLKSGIHALLGENGAGKSTLVKIISGQILPDEGNIFIDNNEVILGSPKNSIEKGIGLLNQDPLDFSNLSIFESFLIGINEKNPYRNINKIRSKIEKLFNNYRVTVDLNSKTNSLSIGERQQVELLRLLYNGAKLIILDEPTRGVDIGAKTEVLGLINNLAKEGLSVILMTSEMNDLLSLSDRILVMANGEIKKEFLRNKVTQEEIFKASVS